MAITLETKVVDDYNHIILYKSINRYDTSPYGGGNPITNACIHIQGKPSKWMQPCGAQRRQQRNNPQFVLHAQETKTDITTLVVTSIYPATETIDATSCIVLRSQFWLHKASKPHGQFVETMTIACSPSNTQLQSPPTFTNR